jgi:hypothetical protein
MKAWYRLRTADVCGRCGDPMRVGDVAFEIGGAAGWKVRRCHRCASQQGESLPQHIAEQPTVAHEMRTNFSERIDSMRSLARDFKHSQAGER